MTIPLATATPKIESLPTVKFGNTPGVFVDYHVADVSTTVPVFKYGTKERETWPDGNQKTQTVLTVVVTKAANANSGNGVTAEFDDGHGGKVERQLQEGDVVAIFLKNRSEKNFRGALAEMPDKTITLGTFGRSAFTRTENSNKGNPLKIVETKLRPAAPEEAAAVAKCEAVYASRHPQPAAPAQQAAPTAPEMAMAGASVTPAGTVPFDPMAEPFS